MAFYPEELISDICASNDMIEYVSRYVTLKRNGKNYMGLCPFHPEKTPSFHVNPEKQLYYCFGCGAGGNLIQFVQRAENLDFHDALKVLADRAGIALPEDDVNYNDEVHKLREKVYEMNKLTARFFYRQLTGEQGKQALQYLAERKISPKTIKAYGLGYAPDSFDALRTYLAEQGYTDKDMLTAGLVKENNGKIYDRFRDRVIFPIINVRGRVIGFGGRIMNNEADVNGYKPAKYLNSSQTPVFDKGSNLFSLNLAKNSGERSIILCEGYMDVISVYQAGVHNITATLGTALTEKQAKLLKSYTDEVVLCYDSDEAGQKATMRAIDIIMSAGLRAKVLRLAGAKDPDEYIKAKGIEKFREAVRSAVPATEYRLSLAKRNYNTDTPDGKIGFMSEVTEILSGLDNAVEIDAYAKSVSEETGISRKAIEGEISKKLKSNARKNAFAAKQVLNRKDIKNTSGGVIIKEKTGKLYDAQKTLLQIMAADKKMFLYIKEKLSPEDFEDELFGKFAKEIYAAREKEAEPDINYMISALCTSAEEESRAAAVFIDEKISDDKLKETEELVKTLMRGKYEKEKAECKDPVRMQELIRLINSLK